MQSYLLYDARGTAAIFGLPGKSTGEGSISSINTACAHRIGRGQVWIPCDCHGSWTRIYRGSGTFTRAVSILDSIFSPRCRDCKSGTSSEAPVVFRTFTNEVSCSPFFECQPRPSNRLHAPCPLAPLSLRLLCCHLPAAVAALTAHAPKTTVLCRRAESRNCPRDRAMKWQVRPIIASRCPRRRAAASGVPLGGRALGPPKQPRQQLAEGVLSAPPPNLPV